jgi:hypothetical protein
MASSYIRKISVGPDYKSSMNYVVGQKVLGDKYTIYLIKQENGFFKIWIERKNEVTLWKAFNIAMPSCVEYNINF